MLFFASGMPAMFFLAAGRPAMILWASGMPPMFFLAAGKSAMFSALLGGRKASQEKNACHALLVLECQPCFCWLLESQPRKMPAVHFSAAGRPAMLFFAS